jgi:DNA replication protein DnaC|tara:strand:+ start:1282 stop:2067 length:786 start_codon:yes stop_codon:yes gene_type:complete
LLNSKGAKMNIETVRNQFKAIKLNTAASELEQVLSKHKKAVSFTWISDLLEREIDARKEKALMARMKKAHFPEITSLEAFDFSFNPTIDENKIRELATLNFIPNNQICLLLGQPGTGKTHIALALGVLAANKGFRVYCTNLKKLAMDILQAKLKNNLDSLFKKILSAKLWILDDWGVTTMSREIAEEVFDLLDRRKYSSAMILTSNRDIDEWPQVFQDPVLANATIDRIFDRADISIFKGKSYRLKGKIIMKNIDLNSKKK